MRLRYTGAGPVSFVAIGVEVFPGAEFDAPDDVAPGLLARADVEAALPVRRKAPKAVAPVPDFPGSTPDPDVAEEADRGVSDDQ